MAAAPPLAPSCAPRAPLEVETLAISKGEQRLPTGCSTGIAHLGIPATNEDFRKQATFRLLVAKTVVRAGATSLRVRPRPMAGQRLLSTADGVAAVDWPQDGFKLMFPVQVVAFGPCPLSFNIGRASVEG